MPQRRDFILIYKGVGDGTARSFEWSQSRRDVDGETPMCASMIRELQKGWSLPNKGRQSVILRWHHRLSVHTRRLPINRPKVRTKREELW